MHQVLHAQEATVAIPEPVVTTKVRPLDNRTMVRNLAVDAYRGLVMLLMMGEVLQFSKVYAYFNHSLFWKILAFNQTHTQWSGCSVHDMIQPSFSFLVGVALPIPSGSRQRKGTAFPQDAGPHRLALSAADRARHLSPLDEQQPDLLHL